MFRLIAQLWNFTRESEAQRQKRLASEMAQIQLTIACANAKLEDYSFVRPTMQFGEKKLRPWWRHKDSNG